MQFVLNRFKELLGNFSILAVINVALLVDVGYCKVKTPFTCPYLPDTFQEFIKVIFAKTLALFEPFIIQYKAFDNELPKGFGSPNPELGCLKAVYTLANGNNGIEIIKVQIPAHVPVALFLNYSNFSSSCCFLQFPGFVYLFQVVSDDMAFHTK